MLLHWGVWHKDIGTYWIFTSDSDTGGLQFDNQTYTLGGGVYRLVDITGNSGYIRNVSNW